MTLASSFKAATLHANELSRVFELTNGCRLTLLRLNRLNGHGEVRLQRLPSDVSPSNLLSSPERCALLDAAGRGVAAELH